MARGSASDIHLHGRRTINEVNLLWREWFDGLYADGAAAGRLMALHLHPWIMGQPWRIRHLDDGRIGARTRPCGAFDDNLVTAWGRGWYERLYWRRFKSSSVFAYRSIKRRA
jgi:hypothetical protein